MKDIMEQQAKISGLVSLKKWKEEKESKLKGSSVLFPLPAWVHMNITNIHVISFTSVVIYT